MLIFRIEKIIIISFCRLQFYAAVFKNLQNGKPKDWLRNDNNLNMLLNEISENSLTYVKYKIVFYYY